MNQAVSAYASTNSAMDPATADPHQLIQLLFENCLDCLAKARGMIEREDIAGKGKMISQAMDILNCLSASLDHDKAKEFSSHLANLYEYCLRCLFKVNRHNDIALIDEVTGLLRPIKQAWDEVPLSVREQYRAAQKSLGEMS